jgi:hypothetical protein
VSLWPVVGCLFGPVMVGVYWGFGRMITGGLNGKGKVGPRTDHEGPEGIRGIGLLIL